MAKLYKFLMALAVCSFLPGAAQASRYLCVADSAIGFQYESYSNEWTAKQVSNQSQKVFFQYSTESGQWTASAFGSNSIIPCELASSIIICRLNVGELLFNVREFRYQMYDRGDYVVSPIGSPRTNITPPVIFAGTCSQID